MGIYRNHKLITFRGKGMERYYMKLQSYSDMINNYKKAIVNDCLSDIQKNELLDKIYKILFDMIEDNCFFINDILNMIDEDSCVELGYDVCQVKEELKNTYEEYLWNNHSDLSAYYDFE